MGASLEVGVGISPMSGAVCVGIVPVRIVGLHPIAAPVSKAVVANVAWSLKRDAATGVS